MPLIATSPYQPILSGIGMLKSGKISPEAEQAFIDDVCALAKTDAFQDKDKTVQWHSIWIDTLYKGVVQALDLSGQTPLFPIFDTSTTFGVALPIPFSLPDLATKAKINPLELPGKIAEAGIKLSLPTIPMPAIPVTPPIGFIYPPPGSAITAPKLVSLPAPPTFTLPSLIIGLIKLPTDMLTALLVPPSLSLVANIPNLPKAVEDVGNKLLKKLLDGIGLTLEGASSLVATIKVYMKNIVSIICVLIVGQLIGVGQITLDLAILLGLVEK